MGKSLSTCSVAQKLHLYQGTRDCPPLEALTSVKPNLSNLHEWGRRVLVYDVLNSKLGSWEKEGRWVRFNTKSKASHVYWLDKHTISVKHDTKF